MNDVDEDPNLALRDVLTIRFHLPLATRDAVLSKAKLLNLVCTRHSSFGDYSRAEADVTVVEGCELAGCETLVP